MAANIHCFFTAYPEKLFIPGLGLLSFKAEDFAYRFTTPGICEPDQIIPHSLAALALLFLSSYSWVCMTGRMSLRIPR